MATLNIRACALAGAVLLSVSILFLGWAAWLLNWGTALVQAAGSLYIGYAPTFLGSIIGGAWAFADGLIGGALFAWLYNKAAKR